MNLTLHLGTAIALTDEQFEQLARINRDVRLEQTVNGELIMMPPTGGQTGWKSEPRYLRTTLSVEPHGKARCRV